ncbi:MAG: hypothetical protein WBA48_00715 [Xanthobacteraceae bacterium]
MAMDKPSELGAQAVELQQGSADATPRTRAGKVRLRTLSDIDARTAAYRRFKNLVAGYSVDLGGDLSTAQQAIIQRAVSLQLWCEDAEAGYAGTGDLDIATFTTATNALRRLLADIGLERRARDVTPDLSMYLRNRSQEGTER